MHLHTVHCKYANVSCSIQVSSLNTFKTCLLLLDMENSSEVEKSSDFVPEPVATSNLDTSSDWVTFYNSYTSYINFLYK